MKAWVAAILAVLAVCIALRVGAVWREAPFQVERPPAVPYPRADMMR